jgi:hypothetical protein
MSDQVVGAPGDDEVDVFAEFEEGVDGVAGGDELDGGVRDGGGGQRAGDDGGDGPEGFGGFFAAFEDGGVAGFDCQGGDVGDDFGAGFEDDQEDADGACLTLEDESVVEFGFEIDPAD